jgi:hypothetical protein
MDTIAHNKSIYLWKLHIDATFKSHYQLLVDQVIIDIKFIEIINQVIIDIKFIETIMVQSNFCNCNWREIKTTWY